MGVHILHNAENDTAVLYCSTSGWAFGPVFDERDGISASDMAEAFLKWLHIDPRMEDRKLESKYYEFLALNEQQKHDAGLCEMLGVEYDCALCEKQRKEEEAAA